jgi:hypothetical protein
MTFKNYVNKINELYNKYKGIIDNYNVIMMTNLNAKEYSIDDEEIFPEINEYEKIIYLMLNED